MALALGSVTPSALYVGSTQATAMYLGGTLVYSASAAAWGALYNDTFTGTNGAAPNAVWHKATTYPTSGTVTIQNNAMRLSTNSSAVWSPAASIFLGDPSLPAALSAPIKPDCDYTFDYTLLNLSQQYPTIGFRTRNAELWSSGDGGNTPTTGYALVIAPMEKTIDVIQCYNSASVLPNGTPVSVPGLTNPALRIRLLVSGTRLAFKVWLASAGTEPGGVGSDTNWTYDNKNLLFDRSDGSITFVVANGPDAETKTLDIDNFAATARPLTLGSSQPAPTTTYPNFTKSFVENFDTAASAGTSAGQFMAVYANSIQPYDDAGTNWPRQMISSHDGVMDVYMDGTKGSAVTFGPPSTAFDWLGGRFSIRMKCIDAINNGPAFMLWPVSEVWADGEIDFPESVSADGGLIGFQDSPWIHHHSMTPGNEASAQDVSLGVSWRDWHVYSCEWYPPGKAPSPYASNVGVVVYYVDEVEVFRTTQDVPTTKHRYSYQVGNWGNPGHLYIDWVRIDALS